MNPINGPQSTTANSGGSGARNPSGGNSGTPSLGEPTPPPVDEVKIPNHAPQAMNLIVHTDEDTNVSLKLSGKDVDGDELQFIISLKPDHGTLTGEVPNLVYQPEANFNGNDTFVFSVSDGRETSELAKVTIKVKSLNDVPKVAGQTFSLKEDTQQNITLTGVDVDQDALTFRIVEEPKHGSLSGSVPNETHLVCKFCRN